MAGNTDSRVDSFNNRILTITKPGGREIKVCVGILYTLPMVHVSDKVLELRKVDQVANRASDIVEVKRFVKSTPLADIKIPVVDGVYQDGNGNYVLDEDGKFIMAVEDLARYKVLQIAKGVSSNKEAMVIFDKKYKDIIIIPNLEYINCESWAKITVTVVKGFRLGSYYSLGDDLLKGEYNLSNNIESAYAIPEPEAVVSDTLLIDAYGLQSGDSGNHYKDYLYYEKTQNHNGVPVNYGVTRCHTEPVGLICLGTVGEMYPGGLEGNLPLYGIAQPLIRNYALTDMGLVKPNSVDKIYCLIDI